MPKAPSTPAIAIALEPEVIEIPGGIDTLERFRAWARSDSFPERGRIDWLAGRLEVDMSPEDIFTHASPKSAIAGRLVALVQEKDRGLVCIDSSRMSSPEADLSAEPDVVVVFESTLMSGRVKLIAKATGEEDRYVEIEGEPDLVVECVSDSSVVKDKKRLRDLYHRAGVPEYWIVDARRGKTELQVLHHRRDGYVQARTDATGFARSEALGCKVRLTRRRNPSGLVLFRLETQGA
ncbi:MAG: Uma2 family endonuclease [Planctomycetes bacterium]|nr:Uma2 family endonuclease [Planctomycetota bacterium]